MSVLPGSLWQALEPADAGGWLTMPTAPRCEDGDVVAFVGDSITAGDQYRMCAEEPSTVPGAGRRGRLITPAEHFMHRDQVEMADFNASKEYIGTFSGRQKRSDSVPIKSYLGPYAEAKPNESRLIAEIAVHEKEASLNTRPIRHTVTVKPVLGR